MIIPRDNLFDMYRSGRALRWGHPLKGLNFLLLLLFVPRIGVGQEQADLSGTFSPAGPPVDSPVKVDAGPNCIVDLTQRYEVAGGLTGTMEIDYRILVRGPCGSPAGTYREEWIAVGTFAGTLNREPAAGSFVYTATVEEGGEVKGTMVFGGELKGELTVSGEFSAQELRYSGALDRGEGPPERPADGPPEGPRKATRFHPCQS